MYHSIPSIGASFSRASSSNLASGSGLCSASLPAQDLKKKALVGKLRVAEKRVIECLNAEPYEKPFDDEYEKENVKLYKKLFDWRCSVNFEIDPQYMRRLDCCTVIVGGSYLRHRSAGYQYEDGTANCPVCRVTIGKIAPPPRRSKVNMPTKEEKEEVHRCIAEGLKRRLIEPGLDQVEFNEKGIDTTKGIFDLTVSCEDEAKKMRQSTKGQPVQTLLTSFKEQMTFVLSRDAGVEESGDWDVPPTIEIAEEGYGGDGVSGETFGTELSFVVEDTEPYDIHPGGEDISSHSQTVENNTIAAGRYGVSSEGVSHFLNSQPTRNHSSSVCKLASRKRSEDITRCSPHGRLTEPPSNHGIACLERKPITMRSPLPPKRCQEVLIPQRRKSPPVCEPSKRRKRVQAGNCFPAQQEAQFSFTGHLPDQKHPISMSENAEWLSMFATLQETYKIKRIT